MCRHQALIVDFYGVLTDGIDTVMRAWAEADGIGYDHFARSMREWFGEQGEFEARFNPVHALERGELEVPDFESELAARLQRPGAAPIAPQGLVRRMFSRFQQAPDMVGLVRRVHEHGIRTALLSNSWGDQYLRDGWVDMFDVVVISGEVGMRKPERRIFQHTVEQLNTPPERCVFVDDHERNVVAARNLGITSILHESYGQTVSQLETFFSLT